MRVPVGSGKSAPTGEEHHEALRAVLQRFPKVHLYALDALINHIRTYDFLLLSSRLHDLIVVQAHREHELRGGEQGLHCETFADTWPQ